MQSGRRILWGLFIVVLGIALVGACRPARRRTLVLAPPATASLAAAPTASLPAVPTAAPSRAPGAARYPIVLVHGNGGFRRLGPIEYFNGVPDLLRGLGHEVYVAQTAAFHTVQHRSIELEQQLWAVFPDPGQRLNIIAHSMGGLDARAMISRQGVATRVASLTTLATPHRGSPVADVLVGLIPGNVQQAIDTLLQRFGYSWLAIDNLTTPFARTSFNPQTPDVAGVHYQSYGASSDPFRSSGARIQAFLIPTWFMVFAPEGPNDGMVSVDSARWGVDRGVLPTDHFGIVGHFQGHSPFPHLNFYADLAADLARQGF